MCTARTVIKIYKASADYYAWRLKSRYGTNEMSYIKDRGVSNDMISEFKIGSTGSFGKRLYNRLLTVGFSKQDLMESGLFFTDREGSVADRFYNRLVFPIMNIYGNPIGFGARSLDGSEPKYINSQETEIFKKRENLYAMHIAKQTKKDYLILCEGYMDVIAMHQAGFKNAVASLGTSLTPEQCEIIKHFKKNVIVMYDSDVPGRNAAKRAVSILKKAGIMSRVCLLPDAYKDPDELIKVGGHALVSSVLAHSIDGEFFYLRSLDIKERARELFRLDDDKVRKYLSESKKQEKNLQNISR